MFTGIIEETGVVEQAGTRLRIGCSLVLTDLTVGSSVAVNGVCLTAVAVHADGFEADLAPETLQRSDLGDLQYGFLVNLERPVTLQQRLSGHLVQGHVDATAVVESLSRLADGSWWLRVALPSDLMRYVVEKGSIALDGISLTVAALEGDIVSVAIIPHTYGQTSLKGKAAGDRVNVECDVLAKHVERLLLRK